MPTILIGTAVFVLTVTLLVIVLLLARQKLLPSKPVQLALGGAENQSVTAETGDSLLSALAQNGIFVPSACGGQGTCGVCKLRVLKGAGSVLPTESAHLSRKEIRDGYHLACQTRISQDMQLALDDSILSVRRMKCTVVSNDNVATFIKKLVLRLPEGEKLHFRAGGYVQLEAPPHDVSFKDFDISQEYRSDWDKYNLWRYESHVREKVTRAYSMANFPLEEGIIMLNVRIATPPPKSPDAPPGQMSSYIFNLKPGDEVTVLGPFGEFFARETENEMVFIGGGAGMAPMRSHIFDQLLRLNSQRRISFWYGARSLREAFFVEDFDRLAAEHPNFTWQLALSDPLPEDGDRYPRGFIHQVLFEQYLKDHHAPESIEYYLCGPPMMISAVKKMLSDLGVEPENILYDDFGG